jgi:hypothetical protein
MDVAGQGQSEERGVLGQVGGSDRRHAGFRFGLRVGRGCGMRCRGGGGFPR